MQQDGFKDGVQAAFDERWPRAGLEKKDALNFRCKIAQELLDAEEPEIRDELVEQQNTEHEQALQEYHERANSIANPDAGSDEDRHQ
jgi:hypothetical protein